MSGVTLSDLSKYHQGAMKWFKDGLVSEHNKLFAQTEEAGAVSFWPLGGTPLEGKVKFSFKETPPASGDKGPENPSSITGVSSVTIRRLGKNMIPLPLVNQNQATTHGVAFTPHADGSITITGKNDATGSSHFALSPFCIHVETGKRYYIKLDTELVDTYVILQAYNSNGKIFGTARAGTPITIEATRTELIQIRLTILNQSPATYNVDVHPYIGIDDGSTDIEKLEPLDVAVSIPLGDTYYGGEIDLATGVMTVTHHCFTVDGNTNYSTGIGLGENTGSYRLAFYPDKERVKNPYAIGDVIYCDRFPVGGNASEVIAVGLSSVNLQITLLKSRLELGDGASFAEVQTAFKTFFASHPTKFVYPISTPFTVQLTPLQLTALTQKDKYTPRINTVYTDADSIQIRYRKSLIHDEDEKVQAIVALGGNI